MFISTSTVKKKVKSCLWFKFISSRPDSILATFSFYIFRFKYVREKFTFIPASIIYDKITTGQLACLSLQLKCQWIYFLCECITKQFIEKCLFCLMFVYLYNMWICTNNLLKNSLSWYEIYQIKIIYSL